MISKEKSPEDNRKQLNKKKITILYTSKRDAQANRYYQFLQNKLNPILLLMQKWQNNLHASVQSILAMCAWRLSGAC